MRKVMKVSFKVAIDRFPDSSQILLDTLSDARLIGLIEDLEVEGACIDCPISFIDAWIKEKKRGE